MESGASASARRRHLAAGAAELLEERVAHRLEVEPVLRDQLACLDDDVVDVPDQLEPFVEILAAQAQPLTKDLHEVDDLEASPIPDIAQLAMAGVVDRGQCRYPGIGDRCELARGELALEGRQYREAVGLGPDTRHIDLDQLDAGDDREEPTNRRLCSATRFSTRCLISRASASAWSARNTRNGLRSNGRTPNRVS